MSYRQLARIAPTTRSVHWILAVDVDIERFTLRRIQFDRRASVWRIVTEAYTLDAQLSDQLQNIHKYTTPRKLPGAEQRPILRLQYLAATLPTIVTLSF